MKNKENTKDNKITKGYMPIQQKSVNNFTLLKNGIIEESDDFLNDLQWNKIFGTSGGRSQFKKHIGTIKNQLVKRGTTETT